MLLTLDFELFLYASDPCLVYQCKDVKEIKQNLNKTFSSVCDWFDVNKLTIHFGGDKIKKYWLAQNIN